MCCVIEKVLKGRDLGSISESAINSSMDTSFFITHLLFIV